MGNRNVIVVGAAGGVGIETAKKLAGKGYGVVATVLNRAEAEQVRAALPAVAKIVELDLSNADNVKPALTPVLKELGTSFAGAIVCAAISPYGPLEIVPLAQARRTFEINTVADLAVYQACMPFLRESKGRLIFTSSFGGKMALPFIGSYVGSKFALEAMCDVMRREAGRFGVPVVIVEPGGIKTPMVTGQMETIGKEIAALSPESAALYGENYREFQAMLQASYPTSNPPTLIAEVIVEAFEAPKPQARYTAGDDARDLVAMAAKSTDAELDQFLAGMYASFIKGDSTKPAE